MGEVLLDAAIKERTLSNVPRRMQARVISPNERSTRLTQELLVGMQ
jgi:hypothetical protein